MRKNIVHGDLNAGNIITDKKGTEVISIIDFGHNLRVGFFFSDI